ncbi:MAG TPA: hypothetical protein VIG24_12510 [Acidimicrobiia bacterium]
MNLILSQPSIPYAQAMSAALWSLARPTRGEGDTAYAVGWVQHPTTGEVALQLGDYRQRVDPDADVEAFVSALPIPDDEAATLRTTLDNARGQVLAVADWLPPTLRANVLTDEQMRAAGWWPEPAI